MDTVERILYNAALAGISIYGKDYFYVNPLEDRGKSSRQPWFECACRPPNIARLLAYLPSMTYSISKDQSSIWVNLFIGSEVTAKLGRGTVRLRVRTSYPWGGDLSIEAEPGKYLEIRKRWDRGDIVRLEIPMRAETVSSHPLVAENRSKVAIRRGPLVYCTEGVDNPEVDPRRFILRVGEEPKERWPEISGEKILALVVKGHVEEQAGQEIHETLCKGSESLAFSIRLREAEPNMIPYYA